MTAAVAPWLGHALKYAALGLHTFPVHTIINARCTCGDAECKSPGKHPLTLHGVDDASVDPIVLTAWAGMHPYSNLGMAMRDGIVCVDVDPRNGGDVQLENIQAEFGQFPHTVMALTGGGGWHFLFRNSDGRRVAGQLRKGIDLQGDGKYIVVEPSIHGSGRSYSWEASCDPLDGVDFAELPAWIGIAQEAGKAAGPAHVDPVAQRAVGMIDPQQLLELKSALAYLDPDPRETWLTVGMALHSTSAPNAYGIWTEWAQASSKFRADDQRKTWASLSQKPNGVHVETIFALAMKAGWVNPGSALAVKFDEATQAMIDRANAQTRIEIIEAPPEPPVQDFPVRALTDLATWIDSRASSSHPDITRQTVLTIAAAVAARVYCGEGYGTHACLGIVGESTQNTGYARDAVFRAFDEAGMRRMIRGTRANSASAVYQTLWRSPAAVHVVNDYGYLAQFARRQPNGVLDQAFSTMADCYTLGAIYIDNATDAGLKAGATDDQMTIHHPALTTLLVSTHEQMATLLQRGELVRGLLAHCLPVITDSAGTVQRTAGNDPLTPGLRERMRMVRRLPANPGDLSQAEIFGAVPTQRPALIRVRYAVDFAEHAAAIDSISTEPQHSTLLLGAQANVRRICNALGAWHDPQAPLATREIIDWATGYVIKHTRAWIDRHDTLGNDDGKSDVAQKVVAVVVDRKGAGIARSELHNYCRPFKMIREREKRDALIATLIDDGDLIEFTPQGKRKKVLVAARFARHIDKAVQL